MVAKKIEKACRDHGITLKKLCDLSDLKYGTLHQQISRGSPIPFDSIDAISAALDLPLDYFSARNVASKNGLQIARQVLGSIEELIRDEESRRDRPDVAKFWDRLKNGNFQLEALGELLPFCDVYEPIGVTDRWANPVSFGDDSLSVKYLKFKDKEDYYHKLSEFSPEMVHRAAKCHLIARDQEFQITPEVVRETIEGRNVEGRYLRATARVLDERNRVRTVVLTQFVSSISGEQKADLPLT